MQVEQIPSQVWELAVQAPGQAPGQVFEVAVPDAGGTNI